ncbi:MULTISPECIES: alpha/beta hydrolase [Chelatococcus]|uniref:Serine aminopeptidase S33 domain-containing protein n=1 Tax=Chelatococcus caeni TaxID=1348468 RepID=A0A840C437_9HYPH|nr:MULTISPECIES: alpha/beta fold hydrolase [Chelatococcus]ALA16607.1 hypothetical protein AL346_03225 [Chelatococcus sp. CO-6]MBB4019603.1 hypothetical protein [Chelatococcus caeni]
MIKVALNATALFAVVYGLMVAGLVVFQRDLLFPADAAPIDGSVAAIPGLEQVQLETSDGESLNAWVVPPAPNRAVLVFFHGNAGNLALAFRVSRFRQLVADGTGLVAVSYRGYGGSTGRPSEAGLHRDGAAAYAYAAERFGTERLFAYGESLGTGVAVRLAAEQRLAGVILEAPYLSTAKVASGIYPFVPVSLLMNDQFRSDEIVGRIGVPMLILHGMRDGVIPFAHGEALFGLAVTARRFVRFVDGGHVDLFDHGAVPHIQRFIADTLAGRVAGTDVLTVPAQQEAGRR